MSTEHIPQPRQKTSSVDDHVTMPSIQKTISQPSSPQPIQPLSDIQRLLSQQVDAAKQGITKKSYQHMIDKGQVHHAEVDDAITNEIKAFFLWDNGKGLIG